MLKALASKMMKVERETSKLVVGMELQKKLRIALKLK